jgi:hypothetical protein
MEEWRDIPDYENLYQVSSAGQVRRNGKIMKPWVHTDKTTSYYRVGLYKDGVEKIKLVHRLVALAFLPNPENKATVNHIDHNGLNNCLENLEWATPSEQKLHSPNPVGLSGHRNIVNRGGSYQVRIMRNSRWVFNKTFKTLPEAVEARNNYLAL